MFSCVEIFLLPRIFFSLRPRSLLLSPFFPQGWSQECGGTKGMRLLGITTWRGAAAAPPAHMLAAAATLAPWRPTPELFSETLRCVCSRRSCLPSVNYLPVCCLPFSPGLGCTQRSKDSLLQVFVRLCIQMFFKENQ